MPLSLNELNTHLFKAAEAEKRIKAILPEEDEEEIKVLFDKDYPRDFILE